MPILQVSDRSEQGGSVIRRSTEGTKITETFRISEGDNVTVHLLPGGPNYLESYIYGTVRSMPIATGDCWVIETEMETHYVQTFSRIVKLK